MRGMNETTPATPVSPATPAPEAAPPGVPPRVQRWCSQLLDLSRRNRLLNFKEGPHAVRVALKLPARLEDALAEGEAHKILELPPDAAEDFLAAEAEHHRLYVAPTAGAKTYNRVLQLFRAARTDLEEGGSNTLFLALGVLKWKDGKGDKAPVYRAPVLLLPVLLSRLPGKAGFTLKAADDEPVVNVTLLEMLKREQRAAPEGVDPLPADEHGVDVDAVLSSFRASVRSLEGWEVLPEVWLGRFSFSKFLMWKDLTTRLDDLAKSPIVAHLVKGGGAFDDGIPAVEPSQVDGISDEAQPLCPLAADSSQLSAVLAAQRGRNFVLHGPPGTGKSQTITNLIASCMAAGKTVLFVAEKRAALEVVQRRLRKIGLAPFCLELHSNKAGKADVLRQFSESLAYAGTTPPEAWDAELAKLRAARRKLDGYVRALHKPHPCGLTPYRAFSYLLAHGADEEKAAPVAALPDAPLGERGLAESTALVEALAETARDVPAELFDPFAFVWATAWTPSFADEMAAAAGDVLAAADAFAAAAAPVRDALGFDPEALPDARLTAAARLADLLATAPAVPAGLLAADWETLRGALGRWTAFRAAEPAFVPEKLLGLDVASLKRRWAQANAGFFARLFKRGGVRKTVAAALPDGEKLATKNDKFAALLDAIEAAQSAFAEVRSLSSAADAVRDAKPDALAAWTAACDAAWPARDLAGDDGGALLSRLSEELAKPAAHRTPGADALSAFSRAEANLRRRIAALAAPAKSRPGEFPPAGQSWAGGWREAAQAVSGNGGKLREWTRWREAYVACEKGGLAPLAAAVAAGTLAPADGVAALRKRYCERYVRTVLDSDETLRSFFGNGQDALVQTFGRLDGEIADLSRRMILAKLSLRSIKAKKDPALLSELALLNHEVAKKTRQLPPRTLLQRLPGLLPVLKPCLLMSPLSVAQYLPPESDGFDVVVFDEASQLTVWDAVGVLARGKQAVVVGDPKQLPPTNFFQKADPAASDEDAAPDEDAVEDLDSILDECKAAGVPEQALLWHYRSRHESLIAFSNERYYDGKLFTFPSAAVARKGLGVSRVKVEGGVYDRSRTRTNRKEAEAVVAAVVERLLDPAFADKTCGVVTFSMAQQSLIEDLLDDEQTKHPEIQRFFDSSLPEPFFVKNLENVQGDERDAIFFSIGYAPDEKGFFAMNFGPLNRPGGERRLNVAVTRAKEEVVVFTSIDSTQIDLSRTAALGAAHLREFLAYAEKATREAAAAGAPAGGPAEATSAQLGDFEREVADFLRLNGYTVDERIGRSGYRVDLGVRNQPDDGGYAIGVECDGAMYRDAASARDRDESRRGVLEGLGWRMARCWCLEWWFDREGAQRKLLAEVDAAVRREPPPEVASPKSQVASPASGLRPLDLEPETSPGASAHGEGAALAAELAAAKAAPDPDERPYEPAPLDATPRPAGNFNLAVGPVYVKDQMLRIANAEGPIAEKLLFARVLEEWGFQSATENRLKVLKKSVPAELPVTKHLGEKTYWPVGADPSAWHYYRVPGASPRSHRAFKEIPVEEIAAAIAAENRAAVAAGGRAAADPFPGAVARLGLPRRVTADMRPFLDAAKRLAK